MKLNLDANEVKLISQLVLEIQQGAYHAGWILHTAIIWEFYKDNMAQFEAGEAMKRKIRFSTYLALWGYIARQPEREDVWWDLTLSGLRDKLNRMYLQDKFVKLSNRAR